MAVISDFDSSKKTLEIEEVIECERVQTNDYFFCKVGDSIPLMSDNSTFDANDPPPQPFVFSPRHGLVFVAHSSGFCVAKVKDVVAAAKEIKEKGSGSSIQELSFVDVQIGRVSILALSIDSAYVSAVVGGEIQCFSVESLLKKDNKPSFCCSAESNHVKDMIWIKETESSFVVLTYKGTLHFGSMNKTLRHVMDGVDAVGRSVDGGHIAVGKKNNLSIFSSKFEEISQFQLPMDMWTGDSYTIKMDSIRWIRSDSIVVGCFEQKSEGKEENYFVQVIMNKQGDIIDDSAKLTSVDFSDLFTGIDDDIVPAGFGPHLFVNYLKNGGFALVSNRKNIDQHIMLLDWSQENNLVSVVDIDRDSWLPKIGLQENGDENLILGLCVDDSSIYENVKVKIGVEEEKELPSLCLLLCLTLEGKLVMFNFASITGSQSSTQGLSSTTSNASSITVVGPSDIREDTLRLEEERVEQSASDIKLHESKAKEISSALDEVPSENEQKQPEQNKFILGTSKFDQNIRQELIAGKINQQAVEDVNNKKLGKLGQSKDGLISTAGDVVGTEKRVTECTSSLTDKFLDKNLIRTGQGFEEKNKSFDLNSTPTTITSSTSLRGSGVPNARSLITTPAFAKSTLSGSPFASTDVANSSKSFFGNLGSRPSDSVSSATAKALNYNQTSTIGSGFSGLPINTTSVKAQQQESGILQNSTGQSVRPMLGNDKKSSSPVHNSEQNLSKQFSNVQNMANELDKLLQSIEEAGGFRDACTAAHRSSLEALEKGTESLSERNRVWQSCTEERLREIQLLLDKTVQVMARKTHMEGIVKQTTDGHYWDLWNRQKLNSELDQKRNNVYNRNQDLVNWMIELEKHFNALELNLFGESSGGHLVSRPLNSRSAPSRNNQSLHAVHNATISQLAAAKQLSDSLSKQMTVLSIKSPSSKRSTVKRQVFESIGIPYPDDSLHSPNTVKVMGSPSNRRPSVSRSGEARSDSKRIQLSGASSHDLETARRRRDSLDLNWASFEAPKTTVKRMVVQNERPNGGSLFSSMNKQLISPGKLEKPIANHSKALAEQDGNGRKDMPQKLSSDTVATSKFKLAGVIPGSQTVTEQSHRQQLLQEDSFSVTQNRSSSSSLSAASVHPNTKKGSILSTAERPGSLFGSIGRSDSSGAASSEIKASVLQFSEKKSTIPHIQPQPFSFSFGGLAPETEFAKPVGGQHFAETSSKKQGIEASTSLVLPPVTSSSSHNVSMQTLPIIASDDGSTTSTTTKDSNKEVLQVPSSAFSVSSASAPPTSSFTLRDSKEKLPTPAVAVSTPQTASVISSSSKGTEVVSSDSNISSVNSVIDPSKIVSQAANKQSEGDILSVTPQFAEKSASSSDGFNFTRLTPSAPSFEVPKALGSRPDINNSSTQESGIVSNTPEKQPAAIASSLALPSELGGVTGEKSNIDTNLAQEDEMEEEAPETNQTAQASLGSFAGFGIGSTPNVTAPKTNPFGGPIANTQQTMPSSNSLTVPSGELFRPASFNFQSLQASQPSQSGNIGAPSGFGLANTPQISSSSGFGRPSQIGSGQQALGSVLGSFGQSRQLGAGLPGSGFGVPQSPGGGFGGGFATAATGGHGFAAAASGGGFGAAAPSVGGFASAAPSVGGFASAAPSVGGFASAAPSVGGFASAAPSVGGFASAASGAGGFGAFGNPGAGTGTSGFGQFGGSAGGRQTPSDLFTQMRK